jgi:RNA-directed DNA polymerase
MKTRILLALLVLSASTTIAGEKPAEKDKLQAKLRGHFQYYGISGNSRAIERYHYVTKRLVFKWVNRRSQKTSFNWEGFTAYLEHYPLPEPRIVHHLYTLSFVS